MELHLMFMNIVVLLNTFFVTEMIQAGIYVSLSSGSTDNENCGTVEIPCKTLNYTLTTIVKKTLQENEFVINIDGGTNRSSPYKYDVPINIILNRSITMRQWQHSGGTLETQPRPILQRLTTTDYNSYSDHVFTCFGNVTVISIIFHGHQLKTWFVLKSPSAKRYYFKNCLFKLHYLDIYPIIEPDFSDISQRYTDVNTSVDVILNNTTAIFNLLSMTMYHPERLIYIAINSTNSLLQMKVNSYTVSINNSTVSNALLEVIHCNLSILNSKLEWSKIKTDLFLMISFYRSSFANGMLESHFVMISNITNCLFDNFLVKLVCGSTRNSKFYLNVYKTKFVNTVVKQRISALTVTVRQNVNIEITKSIFKNNTSSEIGGVSSLSVHIGEEKYLIIDQVTNNNVLIKDTEFHDQQTNTAVVSFSNEITTLQFSNSYLFCSPGKFVSHHTINKNKDEHLLPAECQKYIKNRVFRNIITDVFLQSTCQICEKDTYNIFGEISYIAKSKYLQQLPKKNCTRCLYSAICENGNVKFKGGNWGYVNQRTKALAMLPCPPYYCCISTKQCVSYNTCGKQRTGRLCSDCLPGYSVDGTHKHRCIQNSKCRNGTLAFCIFTGMAVVVVTILIYCKDIILFLKRTFVNIEAEQNQESEENSMEHLRERLIHESVFIGDQRSALPYQILEQSNQQYISSAENPQPSYIMSGSVKLLLYFYQVGALIRIQSADKTKFLFPNVLDFIFTVFNIKLDISQSNKINACVLPNMTVIEAKLVNLTFIFLAISFIAILFVITSIAISFTRKTDQAERENVISYQLINDDVPTYCCCPFIVRIKCVYVQFLLIAYASLATFAFVAISCVTINEKSYLYVQASIQCYQTWQYFVIVFIAFWVLPFSIALYVAPKLLYECYINTTEFLLMLSFPPFILIVIVKRRFHLKKLNLGGEDAMLAKHLLLVINEPFRKSTTDDGSKLCWESVLTFRRVLLVIARTFIITPLTKLYPIAFLLLFFVFHDIIIQPFADSILNIAEVAIQLVLLSLVFVNMFWAVTREYGFVKIHVYKQLGEALMWYEMLVFLFPFIALLVFIICSIVKRLYRICRRNVFPKHD